jgi:hypothetical protein
MEIKAAKTSKGISIKLNGSSYRIEYPKEVWDSFPDKAKPAFVDNVVHLITIHLPLMLNDNIVRYNTNLPMLAPFFFENLVRDLPDTANLENKSGIEILRKFLNVNYEFASEDVRYPHFNGKMDENSVISFTFGKESLLSAGVSQEIGLGTNLLFVEEPSNEYEKKHKMRLAKKFRKQANLSLKILKHETGILKDHNLMKIPKPEVMVGWEHQMTEYALILLPFSNFYKAKYIIFGHEQSCNESYKTNESIRCFPVFDQTSRWTKQVDAMVKIMTNNEVTVTSLVEPLYELGVLKILHNRYKEFGKYQMSCFAETTDKRWCCACSKCARLYVFLKAVGVDVSGLEFKQNMFNKRFAHLYSLFTTGKKTDGLIGYDMSGCGRDEQLFAFYLAYRNGAKGYLIDKFKENHLEEATKREDELYKRFFGVHPAITIPHPIKKDVFSIYKEELGKG